MRLCLLMLVFPISLVAGGKSIITEEEYALMPPIFEIDDFDTCMMLKEKSLYCYIIFQATPLNANSPPDIWRIIKESSSSDLRYRHDWLRRFVCVPKTCPEANTVNPSDESLVSKLTECFNDKLKILELQVITRNITCRTAAPVYKVDWLDRAAAWLFTSYVFLAILLSLYDFLKRHDTEENYKIFKESTAGKWVTTFSIPSNWSKLKSYPVGGDFDKLRSIQGIRVYMTFVVILVHTCLAFSALPVINPQWLEELNDTGDPLGDVPKRGVFLLSFHFMVSSWMLMNSMLSKSDKKEEISFKFIFQSVVKRYVRFLPILAVIVAFYSTWYRHLPYGPFWTGVCAEGDRCRKNWWANMLFVQNFVDRYNMCHIVSWYLAVEMHYYIINLVLIKLMFKFKTKVPFFIASLLSLSTLLAFYDHYRHKYPSTLSGKPEEIYNLAFNKQPQWHDHFASYHANYAGSVVGLLLGYYYYQYKNKRIFTGKVSQVLWWVSSLGLINCSLLVPIFFDVDQTPFHSAVWVAATRPLFSLGMGLLVLGISQGLGGVVKWTFEWAPLQYLAKLSYCVYIFHTVFQNIRVGVFRTPEYMNYYLFATAVLADITMAFLAAVPLTLFFEAPSNEIANRLFRPKKSTKKD